LDPAILACIKNRDGSSAIRWDLAPDRKRLTRKNTEPWYGKTVVLNDIFAPEHSDEQLDMLLKKIIFLPRTQFVILTAHAARMNEYMMWLWRMRELSCWGHADEWVKCFSWHKSWANIWFGISVKKDDQDFDAVDRLTKMPSYRRFIVLDGEHPAAGIDWMIPKCKRCGGRGSYTTDPQRTGQWSAVSARAGIFHATSSSAGREREVGAISSRPQSSSGIRRRLGGEISWVIIPRSQQAFPRRHSAASSRLSASTALPYSRRGCRADCDRTP
jgi:hypothetical protein